MQLWNSGMQNFKNKCKIKKNGIKNPDLSVEKLHMFMTFYKAESTLA